MLVQFLIRKPARCCTCLAVTTKDIPKRKVDDEQRGLSSLQGLFHKAKKNADAAVEASYVVGESTAKVEKPFTTGPFPKD